RAAMPHEQIRTQARATLPHQAKSGLDVGAQACAPRILYPTRRLMTDKFFYGARAMNRTMTRSKTDEMTKQKIVAAIVEYAERLGEVPSLKQLMRVSDCTKRQVKRHFGSYAAALRECNLERYGGG